MKKIFATTLLLGISIGANAAVSKLTAKVDRVLHMSDDTYGGCMAFVSVDPATVGLNCKNWVSFSCSGDFTSKDNAYRMFDMSQMALALNKNVQVFVNDAKKHNGYCFVERIDVQR